MSRAAATVALLAIAATCLQGCAGVRPWEREVLSRSDMAWEPDALEAQRRNHVYFSKEAALAGGSGGGGGCGCN